MKSLLDTGVGFDLLLADPPWHYNDRRNVRTRFGGGARRHYPLMKAEEIRALPVSQIVARNAVLFLWATGPHNPEVAPVMVAWGFRFCTLGFIWVKVARNGTPRVLPGHYTASNAEMVWIGARGRFLPPAKRLIAQVVLAPASRVHSAKPAEVRTRIEQMYPDARRLELFARERAAGWSAWGSEVTR